MLKTTHKNNLTKIFEKISKKFLDGKVKNPNKILDRMNTSCISEQDSVILCLETLTDIINFSVYIENTFIQDQISDNMSYEIETFTKKLESNLIEKVEEITISETTYTEEEIEKYFIKCIESFSQNVFKKNGNLIITFT
jgi:hypothetical protein